MLSGLWAAEAAVPRRSCPFGGRGFVNHPKILDSGDDSHRSALVGADLSETTDERFSRVDSEIDCGPSSAPGDCPLRAEWGQRIHVGRREEVWVFGAMEPISRGVLNPISPR